jgi:hypothetical protein
MGLPAAENAKMADKSEFPDQGGNFPHRRFTFPARSQKIPCSDAQGIGSQDSDLNAVFCCC